MPTLTELPQWTIRTADAQVTFTPVAQAGGPRVADGRGFALHADALPGFAKALGEVMKLPAYWQARARSARPGLDGEALWSEPRRDAVDGFVHVDGPCHGSAEAFTLDLVDVRELRVRIAAHLRA